MAQYNIGTKQYVDRNNDLFEVNLAADERGTLWNTSYTKSAFSIPKIAQDYSLFHGMFSFGILSRIWEEIQFAVLDAENYVYFPTHLVGFTYGTAENQILNLSSGSTVNVGAGLRSKRHALYQPGHGMLYDVSAICPDPNNVGVRNWGISLPRDCIRFQLEGTGTDWELFAFRKNRDSIDLNMPLRQYLPDDFDISKAHYYQLQFNSIGSINYFVDGNLIFSEDNTNQLIGPIVSDPALPIVFESICLEEGTEVVFQCYSVDISTEGGRDDIRIQGSISTVGLVTTQATGTAVLALKVPRTISFYDEPNLYYSRGLLLNKTTSWCRDESILRLHVIRDTQAPNLEALTWTAIPDSHLLKLVGGDLSNLNTAFQLDKANSYVIANEWADLEVKNDVTSLDRSNPFAVTPADILVIEIVPISANKSAAASIYYSEIR